MLDFTNDDSIDALIEKASTAYTAAKNDKRSRIKVYEEISNP